MKKLSENQVGRVLKSSIDRPFQKAENLHDIAKLRSSGRWQKLRAWILKHHPLCFLCVKPAREIHHIEEAAKRPDLFFTVSNLAQLCDDCHVKIKGAQSRGFSSIQMFPKDKRLKG